MPFIANLFCGIFRLLTDVLGLDEELCTIIDQQQLVCFLKSVVFLLMYVILHIVGVASFCNADSNLCLLGYFDYLLHCLMRPRNKKILSKT